MPLSDLLDDHLPAFAPIEDLMLAIFRPLEDEIPGLVVCTKIPANASLPLIMVRREPGAFSSDSFGNARDSRFLDRAVVKVDTFVGGIDADADSALLQDIIRRRFFTVLKRQTTYPGMGHLVYLKLSAPAHSTSDWATSTGVVQYASLPKGWKRYESTYGLIVKPDFNSSRDPLDPIVAE